MRISRGVLHDLYVEDFRAAVMVGEEVIVLSELATSIVLTVPESGQTTLESVTATLVEQYGEPEPPGDATSLAREQVLELAAHDILVIDDGSTRPTANTATAAEVLLAVHGALGAAMRPAAARWTLPSDIPDDQFLATVTRQRVGSQLATGLDHLGLPDLLAARLRAHSEGAAAACRTLATDTHRALDALPGSGVDALVFKGQPLAVQAWGEEAARGYGDIDLLVRPGDVATAIACLGNAGWTVSSSYPATGSSWAWRQFLRQDNELALSLGTSVIDLHWSASPYRSTLPGFEELWHRHTTVEISGRPVATFSAYDALAHSASHTARDHWRWVRGLADVYRLAASPATWQDVDRPLSPGQLLSLGLAMQTFGPLTGAPDVIQEAADRAQRLWSTTVERQLGPAEVAVGEWLPGVSLRDQLRTPWLAQASPADYARVVMRSSMPTRLLTQETSPHAMVAAPRVLRRRLAEVARKVSRA